MDKAANGESDFDDESDDADEDNIAVVPPRYFLNTLEEVVDAVVSKSSKRRTAMSTS